MRIRCFDLGGNGLKTCLCEQDVPEVVPIRLGQAPSLDIAAWIRSKVTTLDEEIANQTCFSFSLAGLDKLTSSKPKLENKRDAKHIAKLFSLPTDRVCTLNDGDTHLLASRHHLGISHFPHMNCSIGSGVGFGIYDSNGNLVSEDMLFQALGAAPWDLMTSSSAANRKASFALANKGLDELKKEAGESALSSFENRWAKFLSQTLFNRLKPHDLMPKEFTFTGGVTDFYPFWVSPSNIDGCLVRRGPPNGGLLGAKLNAIKRLT